MSLRGNRAYSNDGDLDFVLTGHDGSNYTSKIFRNDANVFTDINAGLTGVQGSSAAWGDYDNDGDLDVCLAGRESDNDYIAISIEITPVHWSMSTQEFLDSGILLLTGAIMTMMVTSISYCPV
jgi:hypothetical protein